MATYDIDLQQVRKTFIFEKTAEAEKQRERLWNEMDRDKNGFINLVQLEEGLKKHSCCPKFLECRPSIIRAFNAAKAAYKGKDSLNPDQINRAEFRLVLEYLRQYIEYYKATYEGKPDNGRVTFEDFKRLTPLFEAFIGETKDYRAMYDEIDVNNDNNALFDEMCEWAIRKSLEREDNSV